MPTALDRVASTGSWRAVLGTGTDSQALAPVHLRLKAQGKECEVRLEGEKLIIDHPGGWRILKLVPKLYKDGPQYLTESLNGPSKAVLGEALAANKGLLLAIWQDIKEQDPAIVGDVEEDPGKTDIQRAIAGLQSSLQRNRSVVLQSLKDNRTLVTSWLASHKELYGIFLEGDVHLFVKDIVDIQQSIAKSGDGFIEIEALGIQEPIRVEFLAEHADGFNTLCKELGASTE